MYSQAKLMELEQIVRERWPYLTIVRESYAGPRKMCTFLDRDHGQFSTVPRNLLSGRSRPGHPDRFKDEVRAMRSAAGKKAREKLGPLDTGKMRQARAASIAKNGVSEKFRLATKKNLERANAALLAKYGVDSFFKTPGFHASLPADHFQKCGRATQAKNLRSSLKNKSHHLKTVMARCEKDTSRKHHVLSDGRLAIEVCRENNVPPCFALKLLKRAGEEAFLMWIKEHKDAGNFLERFCMSTFGIERYQKKILGRIPDMIVKDGVFFNSDGLYWHSEKRVSKTHHFEMRQTFEAAGMRLIQLREDEIFSKPLICASIISAIKGQSTKLHARQTSLREVTAEETRKFLSVNHLMAPISRAGYGLFKGDELISVMCISHRNGGVKIERFCSKIGYVVVGALSKLLHCIETRLAPRFVESWVDLRYGDGHSLEKLGFVKVKETLGWKWTDGRRTFHRLRCRANMDQRRLSERRHAEELGWYKIYDAGQRLYRREKW